MTTILTLTIELPDTLPEFYNTDEWDVSKYQPQSPEYQAETEQIVRDALDLDDETFPGKAHFRWSTE